MIHHFFGARASCFVGAFERVLSLLFIIKKLTLVF